MTTTAKAIGSATKTTTGVERGLDVTVSVTLPSGRTIECDTTILPAEDGRPVYERWGSLDHWLSGGVIRALRTEYAGRDDMGDAIDAIEAAASRACGSP